MCQNTFHELVKCKKQNAYSGKKAQEKTMFGTLYKIITTRGKTNKEKVNFILVRRINIEPVRPKKRKTTFSKRLDSRNVMNE